MLITLRIAIVTTCATLGVFVGRLISPYAVEWYGVPQKVQYATNTAYSHSRRSADALTGIASGLFDATGEVLGGLIGIVMFFFTFAIQMIAMFWWIIAILFVIGVVAERIADTNKGAAHYRHVDTVSEACKDMFAPSVWAFAALAYAVPLWAILK